MKTMEEWMYRPTFSWPRAVVVDERSASRPCHFTPGGRAPGTHCIGGWVDARADLDDIEKWKFLTLQGLELRPLSHPARSQSLYRLRYRVPHYIYWRITNVRKIVVWGLLSNVVIQPVNSPRCITATFTDKLSKAPSLPNPHILNPY
jgi:hypothetical protein